MVKVRSEWVLAHRANAASDEDEVGAVGEGEGEDVALDDAAEGDTKHCA